MVYCFDVSRTFDRALPCLLPAGYGLRTQSRFSVVMREKFGARRGYFGERAIDDICDAGVKRAPRLAQQCPIGGILHKRMLEQVARLRRYALPKQQTSLNETLKRRSQICLGFARYRSQQRMGELPADRRSDLRDLLG